MVAGVCDRGYSLYGRQEKYIRQDAASKDMTLVTYFLVEIPILKSPNFSKFSNFSGGQQPFKALEGTLPT